MVGGHAGRIRTRDTSTLANITSFDKSSQNLSKSDLKILFCCFGETKAQRQTAFLEIAEFAKTFQMSSRVQTVRKPCMRHKDIGATRSGASIFADVCKRLQDKSV